MVQALTDGFQRCQVGGDKDQIEVVRRHPSDFFRRLQTQYLKIRELSLKHRRNFNVLRRVLIIDPVKIQADTQVCRQWCTLETEFENTQALPVRQSAQPLGDMFSQTAQQRLVTGRAEHQAGQYGGRGFPWQQLRNLHLTADQLQQMHADPADRMNDLEVFGIAAEQFLPDVLCTRSLALIGKLPAAIACRNQAAILQRLLKKMVKIASCFPGGALLQRQLTAQLLDGFQHETATQTVEQRVDFIGITEQFGIIRDRAKVLLQLRLQPCVRQWQCAFIRRIGFGNPDKVHQFDVATAILVQPNPTKTGVLDADDRAAIDVVQREVRQQGMR
ncbi:hypothetical protein D3C85_579890 [compost metagenome]